MCQTGWYFTICRRAQAGAEGHVTITKGTRKPNSEEALCDCAMICPRQAMLLPCPFCISENLEKVAEERAMMEAMFPETDLEPVLGVRDVIIPSGSSSTSSSAKMESPKGPNSSAIFDFTGKRYPEDARKPSTIPPDLRKRMWHAAIACRESLAKAGTESVELLGALTLDEGEEGSGCDKDLNFPREL